MSHPSAEESVSITEEFAQLSAQRDALEAEITAIADELTSGTNAPGLRGSLIDDEGFPRGDIDIYRVRHQRHAFICKQNDHRAVMDKIEKLLPQLFEARKLAQKPAATSLPLPPPPPQPFSTAIAVQATPLSTPVSKRTEMEKTKLPFAVVESVQDESPAALADLHAGDLVLSFGSADATNHRNLEAIREIVLRNIGSPIRVVVRRQAQTAPQDTQEIQELVLTPQKWSGPGVLGCLLVPVRSNDSDNDVLNSQP